MYIIIFDDGSIRQTKSIDESCLYEFEDDLLDIIDINKMKILEKIEEGELTWVDIKQI